MKVQIIVDISDVKDLEEMQKIMDGLKEIKSEEPAKLSRNRAAEEAKVLPDALDEHLKMQKRQQERDRERLAMSREGLGISV